MPFYIIITTYVGKKFTKYVWQDFDWKTWPWWKHGHNDFRNIFNGILNSIHNMNLEIKHLKILPLEYEPKI